MASPMLGCSSVIPNARKMFVGLIHGLLDGAEVDAGFLLLDCVSHADAPPRFAEINDMTAHGKFRSAYRF